MKISLGKQKITIAEKLKVTKKVWAYNEGYDEKLNNSKSNQTWGEKRKKKMTRMSKVYLAKTIWAIRSHLCKRKSHETDLNRNAANK